MTTSNINQLLIRNIDSMTAVNLLLVNVAGDGFITQYLKQNLGSKINCYHTNFAEYLINKAIKNKQVKTHFCVEYKADIKHDLVIIAFPKSKDEFIFTLAMLAQSMTDDATLIIVGENKGGIKSAEKLAKNYVSFCNKVDAARHCLLYIAQFKTVLPPFNIQDFYSYYQVDIDNKKIKVAALPGVFSQKRLDVGTELLLENLPKNITGKVLDFGCGAGVISAYIGTLHPSTKLSLVDVSALALHSAQTTMALNHLSGEFIASNSLSHVKESYDFVVSNPPFHQGVKTSYAATEQFLSEIKQNLATHGCITIVANSFLKYAPIMKTTIGLTKTLVINKGFSVYQCFIKA